MPSLPKANALSPPTGTEQNTVNVPEIHPLPNAQAIEPRTDHTAQSSTTVSGGQRLRVEVRLDSRPCFQGPLSRATCRSLKITNSNAYSVAFKLKTTHPQLHCARPHSGRVDSGRTMNVIIESILLPEKSSLDKRCTHKFLIEISGIVSGRDNLPLNNALVGSRGYPETQFYNFYMTYAPADGLTQAEKLNAAAGIAHSTLEDWPGLQKGSDTSILDLHDHDSTKEEAQPSLRLIEEKAHSTSEQEAHQGSSQRMCINICPADVFVLQRPLTRSISRSLIISNSNAYPIAFKLYTTKPELYFTRPNSGEIEPGQNMNIIVERVPLAEEPPLDEQCEDQFLVKITAPLIPARKDLRVSAFDVCKEPKDNIHHKLYKLHVKYIPADGLTAEDFAKYEAGMAPHIPKEPLSICPHVCLYINRPLRNPFNLSKKITVTNIFTRPMAFMVLLTVQNAQMYTVSPASARIESGQCFEVQVVRKPVEVEPKEHENCTDIFSFLSTVIYPEQDHLDLNDIWAVAKSNKQAIFQQKLPVFFVPQQALPAEAMQVQQGLLDYLQNTEALEKARDLDMGKSEGHKECTYPDLPSKATIQKWLLSVTPDMA